MSKNSKENCSKSQKDFEESCDERSEEKSKFTEALESGFLKPKSELEIQEEPSPKSAQSETTCPICGKNFDSNAINVHIDICLNKEAIRDLRREEENADRSKKRKIVSKNNSDRKKSKNSDIKTKSILNFFSPKTTSL